ncbi:MAG: BamA/TamA family outer membrane protein [Calditrichia bacterium]|nr:BamA/TamA family outer membrane protein [Calditrichia bacterium]
MPDNYITNLKLTLAGAIVSKKLAAILISIFLFIQPARADLKVHKIVFEGNHSIESSQLREILKIKEKKEFDNKIYRIDKIILNNYYLSQGFLNVWIETDINRKGDQVDVIFNISEGKRFVLGNINFAGGQLLREGEFRKFFKIRDNEFFQFVKIEEGLNALEDYYFNHGKPYVEIKQHQSFNDSLVYVTIEVKENETVHIARIDYSGLRTVKQFIIGRELIIRQHDVYSRKKIEESQKNIYSTGLFDFVGMELRAVDSTRSRANLIVKVVEKKTKWVGVRFGIGYEQEIVFGGTFDFTLEFGHRNLFGTARSIYVSAIPSFSYDFNQRRITNPKNQFSFNYIEPWIGYTRTPGIFRIAFTQVRPLYAANYDYFTSAFLIQHDFDKDWKITGAIAYNRVQILKGDSLDVEFYQITRGQDFIYSLSSRLVKDTRDNYLNPQYGSVTDFNLKLAYARTRDNNTGDISDNRFIKLIFAWNRYQKFRFQRKWLLASRFKIGNIFSLDQKSQVPVSDRLYLGGASTVRGYREQLLGPVAFDENGQNPLAIGGKFMLLTNLEFRIPMFWLLWGVVFLDVGNVWLSANDFNATEIKSTSGAGVAILTPLGPIRFDYGFKHQPEYYESSGEFHISIAFAF